MALRRNRRGARMFSHARCWSASSLEPYSYQGTSAFEGTLACRRFLMLGFSSGILTHPLVRASPLNPFDLTHPTGALASPADHATRSSDDRQTSRNQTSSPANTVPTLSQLRLAVPMGWERRRKWPVSTNAAVIGGGLLAMVLMVLYKAVSETHPDTVARRHGGTAARARGDRHFLT